MECAIAKHSKTWRSVEMYVDKNQALGCLQEDYIHYCDVSVSWSALWEIKCFFVIFFFDALSIHVYIWSSDDFGNSFSISHSPVTTQIFHLILLSTDFILISIGTKLKIACTRKACGKFTLLKIWGLIYFLTRVYVWAGAGRFWLINWVELGVSILNTNLAI